MQLPLEGIQILKLKTSDENKTRVRSLQNVKLKIHGPSHGNTPKYKKVCKHFKISF
jgi:hypothetical protein